jgi:hypothetical protein
MLHPQIPCPHPAKFRARRFGLLDSPRYWHRSADAGKHYPFSAFSGFHRSCSRQTLPEAQTRHGTKDNPPAKLTKITQEK